MAKPTIQFIVDNLQESLEVEVKNWLNGLQENGDKASLAKEIIALANHGGGYIFIGFADEEGFPEVPPEAGELEAYHQDAIAGIVQRFVNPPCQCSLEFVTRAGSDQRHPVIVVPGEHRTPLYAIRGGPNGELESGRVYVRRPGGNSEMARTQDDWEKLIERLVKARQADMLDAIREVLHPSERVISEEDTDLEIWHLESYAAWQQIVNQFEADDPRRFERGHWSVSFSITPFDNPRLTQLSAVLDREMPRHSGWPPFTYLHRDLGRPHAEGDMVTGYIGETGPTEHADYWRVSRDGKGFLLRPMQEDRDNYLPNIYPRPEDPFFDWVLPIYRSVEMLKFIERLSEHFGREDSQFQLMVEYRNVQGRSLFQGDRRYNLFDGATCRTDTIRSSTTAEVSEVSTNLDELIFSFLSPVYEQFEFTELPMQLVTNVVREVLQTRF